MRNENQPIEKIKREKSSIIKHDNRNKKNNSSLRHSNLNSPSRSIFYNLNDNPDPWRYNPNYSSIYK